MKYIVLIIGLLVVGCGKQEKAVTNESTPTTNTNKVDGTTEKPENELTLEEKVIGEYEMKEGEDTLRAVFLDNGIWEAYENGKKIIERKWSISKEGEMHVIDKDGYILVHRINKDESITGIAIIYKDGKREDWKENQTTLKKIK